MIDLSLVTTTLLDLLKARVDVLGALPPTLLPITYTGVSSAQLAGDHHALAMFLYHANEDPHFKNQPP